MSSTHGLNHFVESARRLLSLPAVALEVLKLTAEPDVDIRALRSCVENDPALVSKILRVVNSSFFGLSHDVGDLNQAMALLGAKPLKLLVLGFSLSQAVFSDNTGKAVARYWRHTLTKAVAAREISQSVWRLPGDEAFLAALLADLGMLALIQELGEPYAMLTERVLEARGDLSAAEERSLGFTHRQLSIRLLEQWGLADSLVKAAGMPHGRDEIRKLAQGQQPLAHIQRLAQLLADLLVDGRYQLLPEILDAGAQEHNLSHAELAALVSRLNHKVGELADILSLQLPTGQDYRDVLVQAQRQLAAVAEEVAAERVRGPAGDSADHEYALLAAVQGLSAAANSLQNSPERTSRPCSAALAHDRAISAVTQVDAAGVEWRLSDAGQWSAGEGANPALLERLGAAVVGCRQGHCALSLLLVEIDRFGELMRLRGPVEAEKCVRLLGQTCRKLDLPAAGGLQIGAARFGLILPNCERWPALEIARKLVRGVDSLLPAEATSTKTPITLSAGVATVSLPAKNFRALDLLIGAERCLHGAQACGGNTPKSISVY